MNNSIKLVIFKIGTQQFAIPLNNVEQVTHVTEVEQLAKAPEFIMGTINFQGEFLPVVDLRMVFGLAQKEIDLEDQFIIIKTASIKIALWVDSTTDIVEQTEEGITKTDKIMLDTKYVKGIFKFEDGMVLLQDLDELLTGEQVSLLREILKNKNKESTKK